MKTTVLKATIILGCFFFSSMSFANQSGFKTKTQLFQQLSDAGIDQVIEIPYNPTIVGVIAGQARVHNILEMQDHRNQLPNPTSLMSQYLSSHEYYNDRDMIPSLTYRTGSGRCNYEEAIKVSDLLVCYIRAGNNHMRTPGGDACTTVTRPLSHCYIFAHSVDDVVRAISSIETE